MHFTLVGAQKAMAKMTKSKGKVHCFAIVIFGMLILNGKQLANAQDPLEIVASLGMGAAMSAMDILTQGAAIRGGSDLGIGKIKKTYFQALLHINCVFLKMFLDNN